MDEFNEVGCDCVNNEVDESNEAKFKAVPEAVSVKPNEDEVDNAFAQGISVTCTTCFEKQQDVTFNKCEDVKDITVQNVMLKGEVRLLKVHVNLDKVCSGRKIALAVIVCENVGGSYITKGIRACEFTVPGNPGVCTKNIKVGEFCFVIPEDDLCDIRKLKVNVIAHYSSFPNFPFCHC